jgi:hypothetical protein
MRCPKCEEGELVKIRFRKTNEVAYLCDFCNRFWFIGEMIGSETPGHAIKSYTAGDSIEYVVLESDEKDQEHKPAKHVDYK